ncbi:unnamed protein product [Dovyalis caffra]|uniref:Pentatricopeptide repeat-containing protein n=1 Tax=Dovyalis caffra TaxID=77055 RepID=A0AAV1S026_9ROSI|nr:unnamed protein product [Dovyalis caffra]
MADDDTSSSFTFCFTMPFLFSDKQNDPVEVAYEVFEEMKKRGFVIEQSTYALVIQALCVANKAECAFINLQQMIWDKTPIKTFGLPGNQTQVCTVPLLYH